MDSDWVKGAPLQGEDHTQRPRHQVALAFSLPGIQSPWPLPVPALAPTTGTAVTLY